MNSKSFTDVIKSSKSSTGYLYIDSRDTFDVGLETMVFICDKNGEVTDWMDLDSDRYSTVDEMELGHKRMISKWS
jgi:uncharacterized protein YcgL (UPF0745 family)